MEVASQTEQIPQTEPLRLTSFGTSPSQGEALGLRKRKAPLVKGSWPEGPEGLVRRSGHGSPFRGAVSRRLTERSSQICCNLSVSAAPSHLP